MKPSIFNEPSAHGVEQIRAETDHWLNTAVLKLKFTGSLLGQPREGEFGIFGTMAMLTQFEAIATAINAFSQVEVE